MSTPAPRAAAVGAEGSSDAASSRGSEVRRLRFVCISDTHGHHKKYFASTKIPAGDVLLHAGDIEADYVGLAKILKGLPHKYIVLVPGNHDRLDSVMGMTDPGRNMFVLNSSCCWVPGLFIYGRPTVRSLFNFGFFEPPFVWPAEKPPERPKKVDSGAAVAPPASSASSGSSVPAAAAEDDVLVAPPPPSSRQKRPRKRREDPRFVLPSCADVVLTHHGAKTEYCREDLACEDCAPYVGSSGRSTGLDGLRASVDRLRPLAHIFGHIHGLPASTIVDLPDEDPHAQKCLFVSAVSWRAMGEDHFHPPRVYDLEVVVSQSQFQSDEDEGEGECATSSLERDRDRVDVSIELESGVGRIRCVRGSHRWYSVMCASGHLLRFGFGDESHKWRLTASSGVLLRQDGLVVCCRSVADASEDSVPELFLSKDQQAQPAAAVVLSWKYFDDLLYCTLMPNKGQKKKKRAFVLTSCGADGGVKLAEFASDRPPDSFQKWRFR